MELKREHWRRRWWRGQALVDIESAFPPYHLLLQYYRECLRDEVQSRKLSSCFKASSPNTQQWSTLALVPGTCEAVDPLTDKSSNPEHSSYTASTSVHCTSTQLFTEMLQVPCPHTGHSSYTARTQVPLRLWGSTRPRAPAQELTRTLVDRL